MPRRLVVEGNTAELRARQVTAGGQIMSDGYADLLRKLLPDAVVDICYPAANFLARFERAELGFTASIDAATYHLGRGPSVHGVQAVWARTMNVAAGPALNLRTYRNLWFNVRGGAALVRDYDLLDSQGKSLAAVDGDARVAPFFRVALSYRFE